MEIPYNFRETNLVLQLIWESKVDSGIGRGRRCGGRVPPFILQSLVVVFFAITLNTNCVTYFFYISSTFISNARLKLAKTQANAKKMLSICFLKIIHILQTRYHPKIMGHILKNKRNNKCVCINEIIRLIVMKMEMKMKKESHRYDINRRRSRHGHKHRKYKKYLRMMMLICIKQHLSNTWTSIHEKVKQHWGWVEKKRCL